MQSRLLFAVKAVLYNFFFLAVPVLQPFFLLTLHSNDTDNMRTFPSFFCVAIAVLQLSAAAGIFRRDHHRLPLHRKLTSRQESDTLDLPDDVLAVRDTEPLNIAGIEPDLQPSTVNSSIYVAGGWGHNWFNSSGNCGKFARPPPINFFDQDPDANFCSQRQHSQRRECNLGT